MRIFRPLFLFPQRFRRTLPLVVGAGVVGVLGAFVWWFLIRPEVRLPQLLVQLPPPVVAVLREEGSPDPDVLSHVLSSLLPTRVPGVPPGVHPRAFVYVETERGIVPVALAFRRDVSGSAAGGTRWRGFVLFGDAAAVQRMTASPLSPLSREGHAPLSLLRGGHQHVLLVRQSALARQHQLLKDLEKSAGWAALAWSGGPRHITFRAYVHGGTGALKGAREQLPMSLSPLLLAIDGLPLHLLLPQDLPPILAALRSISGVTEELRDLQGILHGQPFSVALLEHEGRAVPLLVSAVDPGDVDAVRTLLLSLFTKRLRELSAVTERVRGPGGATIRHRRPTERVRVISETRENSQFLRAPCGAVMHRSLPTAEACAPGQDLVAILGQGTLVLGTSESAVETAFRALREDAGEQREGGRSTIAVDMARLRRLPLAAAIASQAPVAVRPWLEALESTRAIVRTSGNGVEIVGGILFSSAVPVQ